MMRNPAHPIVGFLLANIPNAISLARLLATPFLLGAVLWGRPGPFKWLLLACLFSDILDGLIARVFRLRSHFGATLDSTADMLVMIIMIAGVCRFQRQFVVAHFLEISVAVAFFGLEIIAALWRYGRISSFHTILNRVAAYAQGIFVISLLFWGYQGWLFQTMIALIIVASLEELLLIYVLSERCVDVPGLRWALSHRGIASR